MNYDSLLPRTLIRAALASDRQAGHPELPARGRETAISWLRRVLTDFDAFETHLAYLCEQLNLPDRAPAAEPCQPGGPPDLTPEALYLGFRHNRPLDEDRAFAVAQQGLEVLDDPALAELLVNPAALDDLASLVESNPSAWWREALAEAGKERTAASGSRAIRSVGLSPQERDRLRQMLPYLCPDLRNTPTRIDAFLVYLEERLPKLARDQRVRDALPAWYADFSRQ